MIQSALRIADRRLQQVADGPAFKTHRPRLVVVPLAAADLTDYVTVGQKIHLNTALALALASLAAAAGHVEAEAAGFVSALARFRQHGIAVANVSEDTAVSRGIGAWRSPDLR